VTLVLFALGFIYVVLCEILDWHGRLEIIQKRWPWVWRLINDRPARLVFMIILAGLLITDIKKDIPPIVAPPVISFAPPAAPRIAEYEYELVKLRKELSARTLRVPSAGAVSSAGTSNPPAPAPSTDSEPSVETTSFIQQAFSNFDRDIAVGTPCVIKITATNESLRMANKVTQLARLVLPSRTAKCQIEGPTGLDSDPDARKEATEGAVHGKIVMRAARNLKGADSFYGTFGFMMPLVREYDLKNSKALIWLQFGDGLRWRN
jgi:hypothetical protein